MQGKRKPKLKYRGSLPDSRGELDAAAHITYSLMIGGGFTNALIKPASSLFCKDNGLYDHWQDAGNVEVTQLVE